MSFTLYILYSPGLDQYYVGHSADIGGRIFRHNNSGSQSTKKAKDWKVVYIEEFLTRSEAAKRETAIKRKKSRKYIEWLIAQKG